MYNYKGKNLNISQELLDEFHKYKGVKFDDEDVEIYLFYHFIKTVEDPYTIFDTLTEKEITDIVIPNIQEEIMIGKHE